MGAFIPQEGITQGILSAIQLANQHHAQQQDIAARQQQLSIAQQEANTASQRLGIETPHIQAATANLQANTNLTNVDLAQKQAAIHFLNGTDQSPDVDASHVDQLTSQIAGPHAQPQPANPTPAPTDNPTQSGPTVTAQPKGVDAYIQALDKKVGLLPEERQAIDNARTLAAPTGDVAGFQKQVQAIVDKRNDPAYARYVAFRNQGMSADAAHQKIAQADARNAALTKIETDPGELSGDKAPAAVSQLQGMLKDADATEQPRIKSLLATAKTAVSANLAFDNAKKANEQAVKDGSPEDAARLWVEGKVNPNDTKARSGPGFYIKTALAAEKLDPTFKPEVAAAQFDVAKSPTNVGFFGSAQSLTDKGGTLDQLEEAAKAIPHGKIPVFNSLADAQKAATGDGPLARYAAVALQVADDGAKVQGGGVGSDSSREGWLKLLPANASEDARHQSVLGIRGGVQSQIDSRIGKNPVLRSMYGSGSAPKADPLGIF